MNYVLFSCLMVGFTATGQTHEPSLLIAGLPSENQGFLIIDNGVFQAAYFVVEVMNKKFTNVSALNTTTLKRYELWNANHLRIDKACWNRDVAGEMNDAIIMLCSPTIVQTVPHFHGLLDWSCGNLDSPGPNG